MSLNTKKFTSPIKVGAASADPSSPEIGMIYYNTVSNTFRIYTTLWSDISIGSSSGAPTITGSRASPQSVVAATGIAFTGSVYSNVWFIQGSGGAVSVTANPQVAVGTTVGQTLRLIGRSSTNTVTLANGTGMSLNGSVILGTDDVINLFWDGTNWLETSRSF